MIPSFSIITSTMNRRLKTLDISFNDFSDEKNFPTVLNDFSNLKKLSFNNCKIKLLHDLSQRMYILLVSNHWYALKYVPKEKQTSEICLTAVTKYGLSLQLLSDEQKTEEICFVAVTQNGFALQYLPEVHQTLKMYLAPLQNNDKILKTTYVIHHKVPKKIKTEYMIKISQLYKNRGKLTRGSTVHFLDCGFPYGILSLVKLPMNEQCGPNYLNGEEEFISQELGFEAEDGDWLYYVNYDWLIKFYKTEKEAQDDSKNWINEVTEILNLDEEELIFEDSDIICCLIGHYFCTE